MPSIDLTVDAAKGINDLGRFGNALDSVNDRIKELNVTQATFNRQGKLVTGVVKQQTGAFETLTQVISKTGKVIRSTYTQDLEAARRAQQKSVNDQIKAQEKLIRAQERAQRERDRDLEKQRKAEEARLKQLSTGEQLLNRIGRNLIQFASYRAFDLLVRGIREGITAAKDFQIQLSLIRTLSQENQQSFVKFGQDVRRISDLSGIDIKDIGKGFYDTISNQIAKGANVAPFVEQATKLARVTGSELPDSVNLLSSAINAYGFSVDDAERLSAQFFATIDEGRVVAGELANTFGRVAVLGSNLGVDIEDLNAVIAITTQKGFKTADALTLLTNLLIKLEKPTEATKAFFESLGVDSGEAAIKLLGFNGVLRAMVEAVRSGQVDVSAFFDEIRGRKQFGIFEQSIDQIERFSDKLKDTTKIVQQYKDAQDIRGESAADKLVKETNKLANVFKVDLGQAILGTLAQFVELTGGVDKFSAQMRGLSFDLKNSGNELIIFGGLAAATAVVITGLGTAFIALAAPIAAAYAAYLVAKPMFQYFLGKDKGTRDLFGKVEIDSLNSTADAIKRNRKDFEDYKRTLETEKQEQQLAALNERIKSIGETYKATIGIIAKANLANNKFLEEAKTKSKEATEAVKIGFEGYTDVIKDRINQIKRGITEANNEIEKSGKAMLGFKESLDSIIFETQLKYASDVLGGQKIALTEDKIQRLTQRATELFKQGTPEAVDAARGLFDEIARLEADNFDRRIELQKSFMEESQEQQVLTVSTADLQAKLNNLLQLRNNLEAEYVKTKEKDVVVTKQIVASETERLRKLEQAFKQYESLDVFTKEGRVKPEFRDPTGRFDPDRLRVEIERLEGAIKESADIDFNQRFQLEILLFQKRTALTKEAALQERAEYFKVLQDRVLTEEAAAKERVENIKKERTQAIKDQEAAIKAFADKSSVLRGFANILGENIDKDNEVAQQKLFRLAIAINNVQSAFETLEKNQIVRGGIKIAQTEDIVRVVDLYDTAVKQILNIRDTFKKDMSLGIQVGDLLMDPGETQQATQRQGEELKAAVLNILKSFTAENIQGQLLEQGIGGQLKTLQKQFPELATTTKETTAEMGKSIGDLGRNEVQFLINQLKEVQRLLNFNPLGGKVGAIEGGGEVFAASGGLVGAFPGQPRGADRYPVWAAKGEYIVNAQSTAAFLPMLKAINDRRNVRYMADGGMVGGDTHIGDINVTVNGAATNNDTGRAIALKLERELRRRNINLTRR